MRTMRTVRLAVGAVLAVLCCRSEPSSGATTTTRGQGGSGGLVRGAGGLGGAGGGASCTWSPNGNPCSADHYCDAPGCGQGYCVPLGASESPARAPVCGCDGANYWNATVAAGFGMAVAAPGECATALACSDILADPCPGALSCDFYCTTAGACGALTHTGRCWGMPLECPTPGPGGIFRLCSDPTLAPCLGE
ncbi:MAG: hypothetical protein IT373_22675, partial [Polyangiaceae bacterium]|nr:hypothetical protein [Polyangiaceae bacterium]